MDEIEYLLDRQAIDECLNAYAGAVDRHDVERILAVYHNDGTDQHGRFRGSPREFVNWVNSVHEKNTIGHMHNICGTYCRVQGSTASTESYLLWAIRRRDDGRVMFGSARYIDQLSRRDGQWKISLRRVVTEMRSLCNASALILDSISGKPWPPGPTFNGTWDRNDLSYQHVPPSVAPGASRAVFDAANHRPLREDLRLLVDRLEIQDRIAESVRGLDRHDSEIFLGAFDAGGRVLADGLEKSPEEYCRDVFSALRRQYVAHTHNRTTPALSLEGTSAVATHVVIGCYRSANRGAVRIVGYRWRDRLQYADGRWRILERHQTTDWSYEADGSLFDTGDGYEHGRLDRTDISYDAPR